jgi:hypothetical protein
MTTIGFDALILTQMENLLTTKELSDAGIFSSYAHAPGWPTSFAGEETYLADALKQSTLKRSCCLNHNADAIQSVSVKIPIPSKDIDGKPYVLNPNVTTANKYPEKLNYIDHPVKIPKAICDANFPLYKYNTDTCFNFMQLYCNNMKKIFKKEIGYPEKTMPVDSFNDAFALYSPECGCYGDLDPDNKVQGAFGNNCFMQHCKWPDAFKDLSSVTDCSGTFCTNILNVTGNKAGGNINVTPSMENSCPNIKKDINHQANNVGTTDASDDTAATPPAAAKPAATPAATPPAKPAATPPATSAATPPATPPATSAGNMVLGSEELVKGFSNTIVLLAAIIILCILIYFITKKK